MQIILQHDSDSREFTLTPQFRVMHLKRLASETFSLGEVFLHTATHFLHNDLLRMCEIFDDTTQVTILVASESPHLPSIGFFRPPLPQSEPNQIENLRPKPTFHTQTRTQKAVKLQLPVTPTVPASSLHEQLTKFKLTSVKKRHRPATVLPYAAYNTIFLVRNGQKYGVSPQMSADEAAVILQVQAGNVLKIYGEQIFLAGTAPLIQYDPVRRCLREQKPLRVTDSGDFTIDQIPEFEYFPQYIADTQLEWTEFVQTDQFRRHALNMQELFEAGGALQKREIPGDSEESVAEACQVYDEEQNQLLLDIESQKEYVNVHLEELTLPPSATKVFDLKTEDEYDLESGITAYKTRYFPKHSDQVSSAWKQKMKPYRSLVFEAEPTLEYKSTKFADAVKQFYSQCTKYFCQISISLVYGSRILSQQLFSTLFDNFQLDPQKCLVQLGVNYNFVLPIKYCDVPVGTKLGITVWLVEKQKIFDKATSSDVQILINKSQQIDSFKLSPKLQNFLRSLSLSKPDDNYYTKIGYTPIASILLNFFDIAMCFQSGQMTVQLWPDITSNWLNSLSIFSVNNVSVSPCQLSLEIPIKKIFKKFKPKQIQVTENVFNSMNQATSQQDALKRFDIVEAFRNKQTFQLTDEDYFNLFLQQDQCLTNPSSIPLVLLSFPIHDQAHYAKFYHLLMEINKIKTLPIETAMELLDCEFPDPIVRDIAVKHLEKLNPQSIKTFSLQLVQILKFESSDRLIKFLINLCVNHFQTIGFEIYWQLRAEMKESLSYSEFYQLILQKIVENISESDRKDLMVTEAILDRTLQIAKSIAANKKRDDKSVTKYTEQLAAQLAELNRRLSESNIQQFKLPFSYTTLLTSFEPSKSRVMDSKKLPLYIRLGRLEGDQSYSIMFKFGDDLRQDALVVQLLTVMNDLWLERGLNMRPRLYKIQTTGPFEGLIEIVDSSETLSDITAQYGGAISAFSKQPVTVWMQKQLEIEKYVERLEKGNDAHDLLVRTEALPLTPKERYAQAVQNFALSAAGACVSTYLLGVTDRHSGNVMLTTDGRFFHIDFGHFMGNFKKKFGFKREKAPFFLTPDMVFFMLQYDELMGGAALAAFKNMGCRAYNVLRKSNRILTVLLKMEVATGIEELAEMRDMAWFDKALKLDLDEKAAEKWFDDMIQEAQGTFLTQFNNYTHIIAHKK